MNDLCNDIMSQWLISCDLRYEVDYDLTVYVDDMMLDIYFLNSLNAKTKINDMLLLLNKICYKYNFKINQSKSLTTINLSKILNIPSITPNKKYLGIYMQPDITSYILLIDNELILKYKHIYIKYHKPPFILHIFNKYYKQIFYHQNQTKNLQIINSIKGKFNYRLTPFCKNDSQRYQLFIKLGYHNLAQLFWN